MRRIKMTKEYEDKFIKRIKTSSTDKELRLIINKIYEDGFQDGTELADKEEEPQKEDNKLPDWNQRLEEITKGIDLCSFEELKYLQHLIFARMIERVETKNVV